MIQFNNGSEIRNANKSNERFCSNKTWYYYDPNNKRQCNNIFTDHIRWCFTHEIKIIFTILSRPYLEMINYATYPKNGEPRAKTSKKLSIDNKIDRNIFSIVIECREKSANISQWVCHIKNWTGSKYEAIYNNLLQIINGSFPTSVFFFEFSKDEFTATVFHGQT